LGAVTFGVSDLGAQSGGFRPRGGRSRNGGSEFGADSSFFSGAVISAVRIGGASPWSWRQDCSGPAGHRGGLIRSHPPARASSLETNDRRAKQIASGPHVANRDIGGSQKGVIPPCGHFIRRPEYPRTARNGVSRHGNPNDPEGNRGSASPFQSRRLEGTRLDRGRIRVAGVVSDLVAGATGSKRTPATPTVGPVRE